MDNAVKQSPDVINLNMFVVVDKIIKKNQLSIKKCSEAMQTLHAGCSKAEPKIFAPPQTLFPGA